MRASCGPVFASHLGCNRAVARRERKKSPSRRAKFFLMAAHCGPIPLSAFGARVGPSPFSSGPMQEVMRQPGAHVLAAGVPPMATLPLAGIMLCGKITLRGGLQSRPASASWQGCSGWPAIPALFPPRHHAHADRRQHGDARPGGDAHGPAVRALRVGAAARVAPRARPRAARASRRVGRVDHSRLDVWNRRGAPPAALALSLSLSLSLTLTLTLTLAPTLTLSPDQVLCLLLEA